MMVIRLEYSRKLHTEIRHCQVNNVRGGCVEYIETTFCKTGLTCKSLCVHCLEKTTMRGNHHGEEAAEKKESMVCLALVGGGGKI